MQKIHFAACLLATSLCSLPAIAQTSGANPSSSNQAAATASNIQFVQAQPSLWRAGDLDGVDVYNDSNEKIGDITDIVIDRSGKVEAVVIGVGGFLGLGQRHVGVPFNALRFEMNTERTAGNSAGAAANRQAGAANNNAGGAPRDTAASTASSGPAGNTETASPGTTSNSSGSATSADVARAATSNNMKPQRAVLSGATKEQLQNAPQWTGNDRNTTRRE